MLEVRLRNKVSEQELEQKVGQVLSDEDYNLLLTRDVTVRKPDGRLLCMYLPHLIPDDLFASVYDIVREASLSYATDNRGIASGLPRVQRYTNQNRTRHRPLYSTIAGAFDPAGPKQYCRLTAFSAKDFEKYRMMWPLLEFIAQEFERRVPDRYSAQMQYVTKTHPDWVIPGTPFTTITLNNTYPTGTHTDKGDLDEGFSTLTVNRRGNWTGGKLVFPEYRVAVPMDQGDLLLMDAHEWHGNTGLYCGNCGEFLRQPKHNCEGRGPLTERISIVSYYRTNMVKCGSMEDENRKRAEVEESNAQRKRKENVRAS